MNVDASNPAAVSRPRRRRRWLPIALVVAAAAAAGAYFWWRSPPPPPLPTVDLSKSEPEVASAVNKALADVTRGPRSAAAWGELGMVLRAHDFDMESVQALRVAEQLDPADWRWPYLQGLTLALFDPEVGVACLRRATDRSPPNRPEPRLRLAEVLAERGQLDDSRALVQVVLDQSPDDPRATLVTARVAADRGDWKAVLTATDPLRNHPACQKRVSALRGEAYQRLGDNGSAVEEWKRSASLPSDVNWPDPLVEEVVSKGVGRAARMKQAVALLSQGRPDAAIDLLQDTIRAAPDAAEAQLLLGQTLIRLGDFNAARQVLRELTSRVPDSVEGWFQRGVAEFLAGDAAAAAESFARTVKLKPDHTLGHFNLGHARKKLGDRAGAAAAFEATLRCRPDHEPARAALQGLTAGK